MPQLSASSSSHQPEPVSMPAIGKAFEFLDRDHSILAFNERVLDWAKRADVPQSDAAPP